MRKEELAYKKGYRITEGGDLIDKNGEKKKLRIDTRGYARFTIKKIKEQVNLQVSYHRLQAYQKYGDKMFHPGIVVRHLDGNKLNNSFLNIAIGTESENMMDIPEHIRYARALHATSFVRKHDKQAIRKYHTESGMSYKKTMDKFSISSKGTLHFILNN